MDSKCVGDCCLGEGWTFDCPCCEGSGSWETEEKCSTCNGSGRMWVSRNNCKPWVEYPPMAWLDVEEEA